MYTSITLFGSNDEALRNKWIMDLADRCVEIFERDQGGTSGDKIPWNNDSSKISKTPELEKAADKAVKKQKARYRKIESVSRELIIETFGVFIGKTKDKLVVKKRGVKIFDFPLQKLETVNIVTKGVSLSSDVIWHCSENAIPIFFSDGFGNPVCVLQSPMAGDADLGLLQLQALQDGGIAMQLGREFVEGKIRNQVNLLKYYGRHRPGTSLYGSALDDEIPQFKRGLEKLNALDFNEQQDYGRIRNTLMGFEAEAARRYWKLVKILISEEVPDFPGRRRKGAKDLVNSLLNYGYGFLYRQVWREVLFSGLNPKISFLHAPQGEKPVLVFDLVEEFRSQAVDRVVLSMLTKNERLKLTKQTGHINEKSRKKLVEALLERQGTSVNYRGQKVLLKNVIKNQIRELCLHLKGEKEYRHFIGYY